LLNVLPKDWQGTCTSVSLIVQIRVIPLGAQELASYVKTPGPLDRKKRSFDLHAGSPIYFDAIGIPRGVPNEYKLINQIAAGFESVIPWITINKNVDRLNYVHFNIQRLTNMTRDAFAGVHEQLSATSIMTYQNRLALDMLLAKDGGVCSIFGQSCCTYIPNNTAPDGSFTKALEGLKALSLELAEHSGKVTPFNNWLNNMFGKWKGVIISVILSVVVGVVVLALCGCCCIPCIRQLCLKCITTAVDSKLPQSYQMALLAEKVRLLEEDGEDEDDGEQLSINGDGSEEELELDAPILYT